MSKLSKIIDSIMDSRGVENLREILGEDLGGKMYHLINEAKQADLELGLTHKCITELYEVDAAVPTIKKYMKKIEKLKP